MADRKVGTIRAPAQERDKTPTSGRTTPTPKARARFEQFKARKASGELTPRKAPGPSMDACTVEVLSDTARRDTVVRIGDHRYHRSEVVKHAAGEAPTTSVVWKIYRQDETAAYHRLNRSWADAAERRWQRHSGAHTSERGGPV